MVHNQIKILTITSLFPNQLQPRLGIFVYRRLQKYIDKFNATASVIAPVPCNILRPVANKLPDKIEVVDKITVYHPRYLYVPVIGRYINPILFFLAIAMAYLRIPAERRAFDIIDAQYMYPDSVAAVMLNIFLGKPITVTVRGSDINVFANYIIPSLWIKWAIKRIDKIICVSRRLCEAIGRLSQHATTVVVRNGVDTEIFQPVSQKHQFIADNHIHGKILLCVGNLVKLKRQKELIQLIKRIPDITLILIGEGDQRELLEKTITELKMRDRVYILSNVTQQELAQWYSSADIVISYSSSEGWPNVILEALACGTPVVATDVGDTKEIIIDDRFGRVVHVNNASAFASAIDEVIKQNIDSGELIKYAASFSWENNIKALNSEYAELLRESS